MTLISDQQSPVQALIPFTGFYMLDVKIGSFIMVDTEQLTVLGSGGKPVSTYSATVTLCADGVTSKQFSLGSHCTFNDNNLVITNTVIGGTTANLRFSNASGNSSVSGTFNDKHVAGSSPFAPISLSLWSGTYYTQGPVDNKVYPYAPTLKIDPDGTVFFAADGAALKPVQQYSYDYAMFVIGLVLGPDPTKATLFEMGTASGWGRVAGNAEHGQMLVSIQLQQPVPNL